MTHTQLVERVQRWLRVSKKHPVVLAEIGSDGRECPDVIGWTNRGSCTLIECKVSRADFLRDRLKTFRRRPDEGMAMFRWYAVPAPAVTTPWVADIGEMPENWGMIEVHARHVCVVKKPLPFLVRNTRGETACLLSAVRRATEGWGRKVFGEISPVHGQPDPYPRNR